MVRKNINLFIIILITITLTSCGAFRNVFKSKDKVKQDTEIIIDKEDKITKEDKSSIVIEEDIDTNILIPSKSFTGISNPVNNLLDIKNLTLVSTGLYTVRQSYDSISKSLKTTLDIDSQKIPVKKRKKTSINNNINTTTLSKDNSQYKQETKIKSSKKEVEGKNSIWAVIFGLGVLSVFSYLTYKYFKNKP